MVFIEIGWIETPVANIEIQYESLQFFTTKHFQFVRVKTLPSQANETGIADQADLYRLDMPSSSEEISIRLMTSNVNCDDQYPESGERYESMRMEKGQAVLHIGFRDSTVVNAHMPPRLRKGDDDFGWVKFDQSGNYQILIPALSSEEKLVIYFSAAWKLNAETEDLSTWFAADSILPW